MSILLTPDETAKMVADWIDEDYATRSVLLERGHWEHIAPVVAQAQVQKVEKWIEPKLGEIDILAGDCIDGGTGIWKIVREIAQELRTAGLGE